MIRRLFVLAIVAGALILSACAGDSAAADPKTVAGRRAIKAATAAAADIPAATLPAATIAAATATPRPPMATIEPAPMAETPPSAVEAYAAEYDGALAQVLPFGVLAVAQMALILFGAITAGQRSDLFSGALIMCIGSVAASAAGLGVFGVGGFAGLIGGILVIALGVIAGAVSLGRLHLFTPEAAHGN